MDVKHRAYVRVVIRQKDERTFHKIKRVALMAGGHPISMQPMRITMGVKKTGTCLFSFPNADKAAEFKRNLASQLSVSRVSAEDSDGVY